MMSEQEYIDVTNLTKIRMARTIVFDALAMTGLEEQWQKSAHENLSQWMEHLEKITQRKA